MTVLYERVGILRFVLIFLVLCIHAQGTVSDYVASNPWYALVVNITANGIARVAVPLFFMISGYMYFVNFNQTTSSVWLKTKRRAVALIGPYLIWNVLTLGAFCLAQATPAFSGFFSGHNLCIRDAGLQYIVGSVFGIGAPPFAYHLWFLRDLFVVSIFVPVLFFANNRFLVVLLCFLSGLWVLGVQLPCPPSIDAILFFFMGALAARLGVDPFYFNKYGAGICATFLLSVMAIAARSEVLNDTICGRLVIVLGIFASLWVSSVMSAWLLLKAAFRSLADASFFVYLAHEPLLTLLRKVLTRLVSPDSTFALVLVYGISVALAWGLLVAFYLVLRSRVPTVLSALTGGR